MTLRDMVVISSGNLVRMKLRTLLTSAGVLIAIAAFVSMLSFGAGNQQYIEKQFSELGLFTTMQVFPKNSAGVSDTLHHPPLDNKAMDRIAALPGVNLVYPFDAFGVSVRFRDSIVDAKAQALPSSAFSTRLFSQFFAGRGFDSASALQVIISDDIAKKLGFTNPDSLLGRKVIVSVRVSKVDSGLSHIFVDKGQPFFERLRKIHADSLRYPSYRSRILRTEGSEVLRRFMNGFMNARGEVNDTLTVCGIRKKAGGVGRLRVESVIIPSSTAARFRAGGFSGDPKDMVTAIMQGNLFPSGDGSGNDSYSQVTVDFDPKVYYKTISDSVEAMGYRTFSFAAEFKEIQRAFLYFNSALALIGLIALTTASLGIINTMVMSITERRKEIGILKSLGADDRDIRGLFLVESGVIGFLGTSGGILVGWLIGRIASAAAQAYMKSQGIPPIDLFALPAWLFLTAFLVGEVVSVGAGYFPALRAARVDPVAALRNE